MGGGELIFVSEPDNGIYDAMNKGLKMASGEWVLFLNADDSLYSENTLDMVFFDHDYHGIDVLYGGTHYEEGKKDWIGKGEDNIDTMPHHKMANSQATFLRRTTHLSYLYDQNYSICADYDVVLKMYLDGRIFKKVPVIINNYGTNGVSSLHPIKAYWQNMQIRFDLGVQKKYDVIVWLKFVRFILISFVSKE